MLKYLGSCLLVTLALSKDVSYKEKLTTLIKEKNDGVAAFDDTISEEMAKEEYLKHTNGEYDKMEIETARSHRLKVSSNTNLKIKRSLVDSDFNYDEGDKEVMLEVHNDYRSALSSQDGTVKDKNGGTYPGSSDMNYLFWDPALEKVAQGWVDSLAASCSGLSHNSGRSSDLQTYKSYATFNVPSNAYVGENIGYTGTSSSNGNIAYSTARLDSMWDEDGDWSYQQYKSSTINGAGHFTQMAWANTRYIGCAGAVCHNSFYRYYTVCNYYPGGNYLNQYPWSTGTVCSDCDSDRTRCDDSQCGGCMSTGFGSTDCNDGFNDVTNAGDAIGDGNGDNGDDDDDNDNSGGNDDDDDDDDDDNDNGCQETSSVFCCDDGCAISKSWYQDNKWCDCSNCEDEDSCSCPSGGCTFSCGGWQTGSCSSSKSSGSGASDRDEGSMSDGSSSSGSSNNNDDDNTGLYIGIGIGAGVVVIALIAFGIIMMKKRKEKEQKVDLDYKEYEAPTVQMNTNGQTVA